MNTKRKEDQISNENQSAMTIGQVKREDKLYGHESKKRKLNDQKVGDFIVKAPNVVHMRLTSDLNKLEDEQFTSKFFSPLFLYWMFGKEERINGYEGLSIDISLSKKRMMPFVQIQYEQKAPAFANIDNIEEKLQKHFGRLYDKPEDFIKLLKEEETLKPRGTLLKELNSNDKDYLINMISLEDESFHEQSFNLQSILPFFIEGASVIEPSPFWKYFLIYDKTTSDLAGFATVFEAHKSAVQYRAKISQVLILPPFQQQGLGQQLYQAIYDYYRNTQDNCFQVLVEDSADDFQKIQDYVNCQTYFNIDESLRETLKLSPIHNVILNTETSKRLTLGKQQIIEYSKKLKLAEPVIMRVHDLIINSVLDQNEAVQKEFRLLIKKRFYIRKVRDYLDLFKSIGNNLFNKAGGLKEPYLFNQDLEDNVFVRPAQNEQEEQKNDKGEDANKFLAQEGIKIDLKTIYFEVQTQYGQLKPKISKYIHDHNK